MPPATVPMSIPKLAQLIDHSLLHPTMTDADITAGLTLARTHSVATACVKPYSVATSASFLAGSPVGVCAVVGFPHGNSSSAIKLAETTEALRSGATEIDMVVNVGKVLGGNYDYVEHEIDALNRVVVTAGGLLKVIFENDYLQDEHIIKLCEICTRLKVAFVKTSSGYGFVKGQDGRYGYEGATLPQLKLMREHCGPEVQIKAAGGVRTLDDVLRVVALGVTRIGASATEALMQEAKARGVTDEEVEMEVKW